MKHKRIIKNGKFPASFLAALVLGVVQLFGQTARPDLGLEDVLFQVQADAGGPNQAIYVLGDQPELGSDDLRKAVRMLSDDGLSWHVSIALPHNTTFSYGFYLRDRLITSVADPANGTLIGRQQVGKTTRRPMGRTRKSLIVNTDLDAPVLHWRQGSGAFKSQPLRSRGLPSARAPKGKLSMQPNQRWGLSNVGLSGQPLEFHLESKDGSKRDPMQGTYITPLDDFFLQAGEIYSYVPAPSVSPARSDYMASAPPMISSSVLLEDRSYRIRLPRGYREHQDKRYPVLYLYDGPAVWDGGRNSWDRRGRSMAKLVASGQVGEMILVAIDPQGSPGSCSFRLSRIIDCVSPEDSARPAGCGSANGMADQFLRFIVEELKPLVDRSYRTLADREHTFATGFSLGGVFAFYAGWEHSDTFGAIAAQSGSFWLPNFTARVLREPSKDLRIFIDIGDSETPLITETTRGLRDNLLLKIPGFVLERNLKFNIGFGDTHSINRAGKRMDPMLEFLYPAQQEQADNPSSISNGR